MAPWKFETIIILDRKDSDETQEHRFQQICGNILKIVFKGAAYEALKGDRNVLAAGRGAFIRVKRGPSWVIIEGVFPSVAEILKLCRTLKIKPEDLTLKPFK